MAGAVVAQAERVSAQAAGHDGWRRSSGEGTRPRLTAESAGQLSINQLTAAAGLARVQREEGLRVAGVRSGIGGDGEYGVAGSVG